MVYFITKSLQTSLQTKQTKQNIFNVFNVFNVCKRTLVNNGGPILYKTLRKNKVEDIFIYSGGAVMPLIDSFYKKNINLYVNSNEFCTGMSAVGYAKSSNKTGVCLVTSGPGITNMITPMLDANTDSTPMVVISGQVPLNAEGTNAFQEAPAVELTKNVTKWSYKLDNINNMEYILNEAFKIANNGKKGVVHIDIPKCVSYQEINDNNNNNKIIYPEYLFFNKKFSIKRKMINTLIDLSKIKKVAELINKSEKPILYIGKGCSKAYKSLRHFATKANIPVTTTIHGTGIFDEHDDLSLRWCGMHGYAPANYSLQEADVIIAIGSRFDDRTTGNLEHYAPNAFEAAKKGTGGIIHVNIEESELDFVVKSHYNFCLDSGIFLDNIIPFIKYNKRNKWFTYINSLKSEYPFKLKTSKSNDSNDSLHMEEVINELYLKTLDKNVVFTTGVGNHQMQSYQFIKSQYPNKILSSGSLGVMGAGLPYSVGTQIANKDKLVIAIDGDSSFNMSFNDMKTIVEHNLPIKIAIMNNSSQMMVTIWEQLFFEERYTATINKQNPKYNKLAEAFGIKSITCNNVNSLSNVVEDFINYNGPILCEFNIKPDICLPLVGPGKALDDMILEDPKNSNMSGMAPS
jgi:acetolactate synthase I/II/III large subunit